MLILAIDPGSTSTKIGIYQDGAFLVKENITHDRCMIDGCPTILEQKGMRAEAISELLTRNNLQDARFDAVVGRGGLVRPVRGGTIAVNEALLTDLRNGFNGHHASNLGGILADEIAREHGCPAFIVDPVVIDEMAPVAKVTGLAGIERKSIFHALNQKAAAHRIAERLRKTYQEATMIVAHLGGGISVGLHAKGNVIDVNNALNGDGPFAPERSGNLPVGQLVDLVQNGTYTVEELHRIFSREGGLYSHFRTANLLEIEERIDNGDEQAKLVFDAMAYNIAKEIGALATAVCGEVDAVVLTGGLARSERLTADITERVSFIADVYVLPGEFELEALVEGTLRVLNGTETAHTYGME